ncbi:YciI family protein [Sorangium sp. So ce406]|uniref:YciI family protein n=1 Tax=Sorangium sp. So ce406 TaxID=3133311 RepID=UPI003F5BC7FA
MSEFVFLYRGKDWTTSPAEMQQRMQKWSAWMKELGEKGHLKNPGHPLERTGKFVEGKQRAVVDGPFAEAKDVIGGYTIVEAEDLAHAVELSKGCPILDAGGAVEVRPIMKLTL